MVWRALNDAPWFARVPIKTGLFLAVLFLVLFPNPRLFVRQIGRLADLDALIDPDEPRLAALHEQFAARVPPDLPNRALHQRVEQFVYETIPYDWDWNVWGSVDYTPTVAEVFDAGREDCDGRAVLAASLLRRMGREAALATDLRHVWVTVGKDELMGPGGEKTAVSTPTGTKVNWRTLRNIPRSLSFGVAVFPLGREMIVLATLALLCWHPGMSWRWGTLGVLALVVGLALLRKGIILAPGLRGFQEREWASALGLLVATMGAVWLLAVAGHARRRHLRDRPVVAATADDPVGGTEG